MGKKPAKNLERQKGYVWKYTLFRKSEGGKGKKRGPRTIKSLRAKTAMGEPLGPVFVFFFLGFLGGKGGKKKEKKYQSEQWGSKKVPTAAEKTQCGKMGQTSKARQKKTVTKTVPPVT